MSPETSTLNASQAVERIREIIVGRHLERLEQRVARLESSDAPASPRYPDFDARVLVAEARIEALQGSLARFAEGSREEIERHHHLQREEIQRLAQQIQQIQQVAAIRTADTRETAAVEQLEQRLGGWLNHWKSAIQQHLDLRDHQIAGHIQSELRTLQAAIDRRLIELETKLPDGKAIELRFKRIADAARAFAEATSQLPPLPLADANPP